MHTSQTDRQTDADPGTHAQAHTHEHISLAQDVNVLLTSEAHVQWEIGEIFIQSSHLRQVTRHCNVAVRTNMKNYQESKIENIVGFHFDSQSFLHHADNQSF